MKIRSICDIKYAIVKKKIILKSKTNELKNSNKILFKFLN